MKKVERLQLAAAIVHCKIWLCHFWPILSEPTARNYPDSDTNCLQLKIPGLKYRNILVQCSDRVVLMLQLSNVTGQHTVDGACQLTAFQERNTKLSTSSTWWCRKRVS